MSSTSTREQVQEEIAEKRKKDLSYRAKAGAFLAFAGGFGFFGGFAGALASSKRSDPSHFDKGLVGKVDAGNQLKKVGNVAESGAALATRALAHGTLYAFAGCGLLFYGVWKLSGARDFDEFRLKLGSLFPSIPKKPAVGRTEFSGLNDLLQYIIDRDNEEKEARKGKS